MNINVNHNIILPLRICNKCCSENVTSTQSPIWKDCTILHCISCENQWYVCSIHAKRFSSSCFKKMNRHFLIHHKNENIIDYENSNKECVQLPNTIFEDDIPYTDNQYNKRQICSNQEQDHHLIQNRKRIKNEHESTNNGFFWDEMEKDSNGIHNLVLSSFQRCKQQNSNIPHEEALFHIQLTNFLTSLSENKQAKLVMLLNKSRNINFTNTRLPRSILETRTFYNGNKTSIYNNIPTPIVSIHDNHAYVSIGSVIHHALSLGIEIPLLKSSHFSQLKIENSHLLNTYKSKEIMKETFEKHYPKIDPYVLFLVIWSDDFEVNHTRKNRSSTWLKTISIVPPSDKNDIGLYTYAICLGSKKDSHFSVNTLFNKELESLKEPNDFYVLNERNYLPISVRVLAMSSDRPERCALNNMSGHSSHSAKRWMYSSLTDPHRMASCIKCFEKRFKKVYSYNQNISTTLCKQCCDFDYFSQSPVNYFNPPQFYPKTAGNSTGSNLFQAPLGRDKFITQGCLKMPPLCLSYTSMTKGLKYAMYQYLIGSWSKKETVCYLKLLCIKEGTINETLKKIDNDKVLCKDYVSIVDELKIPPMWCGLLTLDQFIETPMHLIFEGLVKSSIELLTLYMKFHKKWTKFAKMCNEILEDIETLHLSFCMADGLTNSDDMKTGGWLAETYLAFSRVMIVFIGHVSEYIHHDELGYLELQLMFQSLYALISRLMSNDVSNQSNIDEYIKIFLGLCHFYEEDIGFETNSKGDKHHPFWYNKSNYVSLLNLPEQIKTYGPLRLHWEGVKEKFIQHVKPILKNKRTSASYLVCKLEKIYKQTNFNLITSTWTKESKKKIYQKYKDVKIYKSCQEVSASLKNHESISGLIVKEQPNKIFTIVKKEQQFLLYKLLLDWKNSFVRANLWYCPTQVKTKPMYIFESYDDLLDEIFDYTLLVPFYTKNVVDENGYTVFTKSWKVLKEQNKLMFYDPPLNKFETIISKRFN